MTPVDEFMQSHMGRETRPSRYYRPPSPQVTVEGFGVVATGRTYREARINLLTHRER